MDALYMKLLLSFVLLAISALFGLLPIKLLHFLRATAASQSPRGSKWPSRLLCFMSCFSGGVFLGTCFLHLLPDVVKGVDKVKKDFNYDVHYPIAEFLSCLGFFLVFFAEELVLLCFDHRHMGHSHSHFHHESPATAGSNSEIDKIPPSPTALSSKNEKSVLMKKNEPSNNMTDVHVVSYTHPRTTLCVQSASSSATSSSSGCSPAALNYGSISHVDTKPDAASAVICKSPPEAEVVFQLTDVCNGRDTAEPECCEGPCAGRDEAPPILMERRPHAHSHGVRSTTLVLALSLHSLIEGAALGVQDSTSAALKLFVALAVHKVVVLFSIGVQLARTHAHQLRVVVAAMIFLSAMSPVGAFIGIGVEQSPLHAEWKDLTVVVLGGLSVGTFLYVTFFEVLVHERDNEHNNLLKLLASLVGFGFIAALSAAHAHPHDDDHHHEDLCLSLTSTLHNVTT